MGDSHFRTERSNGDWIIRQDNGRKLSFHSICWKWHVMLWVLHGAKSLAFIAFVFQAKVIISDLGTTMTLIPLFSIIVWEEGCPLQGKYQGVYKFLYTAEVWRWNLQCKPNVKTRNHI